MSTPRQLLPEDRLKPGTWVQLRCPHCAWKSTESLVMDQINGVWHAYQAIGDEWRDHFRMRHTPTAEKWVVPSPSTHGNAEGER